MKKVYLAGFDVFYPDARERGEQMKTLCRKYQLNGLYPLDNQAQNAQDIFHGNLHLIDSCDYVVANLNPFRGLEMDSGTAFEIGYAFAQGKQIFGYREDVRTMREQIGSEDQNGFSVENFDLPVNLMIGCCTRIVQGGLEECLAAIQHIEW